MVVKHGDIAKTNTKVPEDNQTAGTKPVDTKPTNSAVNAPAAQPGTQPVSQPVVPTSQPVASPASDNNFGTSRQREVAGSPQTQPQNTPGNLTEKPVYIPTVASAIPEQPKPEPKSEPKTEVKQPITETAASAPQNIAPKDDSPMNVGSLVSYATRQSPPVYPLAAKSMRASGVVKVEVTVDEKGDVATVQKVSGPMMLQDAAKDAIKKWKFKPFVRDGQPVKATGFINFSFTI